MQCENNEKSTIDNIDLENNESNEINTNEVTDETIENNNNKNCIELENMQKDLNEALEKQEEYLNLAQRVQADFDNFRKRNNTIRKESYDNGAIDFAKSLLPVLDNFERALSALEYEDENNSIMVGINMVYKQLLDSFEKRGISQINRIGEKFDPNLEEAVTKGSPEDGDPGTVCEVLQKGYIMGSNVLRFSMVKVVPE